MEFYHQINVFNRDYNAYITRLVGEGFAETAS